MRDYVAHPLLGVARVCNYSLPPFEKWGDQSEGAAGNLSNKSSPNPSFTKRGTEYLL